jgi:hypothetical protein
MIMQINLSARRRTKMQWSNEPILDIDLDAPGWNVAGFDALMVQLPDCARVEFAPFFDDPSEPGNRNGWVCRLRIEVPDHEPAIFSSDGPFHSANNALRYAIKNLQSWFRPKPEPVGAAEEDLF